MKRLSILTLQFYRSLLVYNLAFTLLAIFIGVIDIGSFNAFFVFGKAAVFASAAGLYHYSARQSYFYYRNAGFSMRKIHITALLFDLVSAVLLFILLITIARCLH